MDITWQKWPAAVAGNMILRRITGIGGCRCDWLFPVRNSFKIDLVLGQLFRLFIDDRMHDLCYRAVDIFHARFPMVKLPIRRYFYMLRTEMYRCTAQAGRHCKSPAPAAVLLAEEFPDHFRTFEIIEIFGCYIKFILKFPWRLIFGNERYVHHVEGCPVVSDHPAFVFKLLEYGSAGERCEDGRLQLIGIDLLGKFNAAIHVLKGIIVNTKDDRRYQPDTVFSAGFGRVDDILDVLTFMNGIQCLLVK